MHPILAVVAFLGFSCLWDSDTLRDEALLRPDVWEVISGQIPRHGEAYYRTRIAQIGAVAKPDRVQLNDLAVAHIRLKEFDQAEKILLGLREVDAADYEALSNLAVLTRNRGNFVQAVPLFEQALKLHPDGHLGLGDWTLRAVQWQALAAQTSALAEKNNFLGEPRPELTWYNTSDTTNSAAWDKLPEKQQDRLRMLNLLLRSYPVFAEGYVTLGDTLADNGDNTLAIESYIRALDLEHPYPDLLRKRIKAVGSRISGWSALFEGPGSEASLNKLITHMREQLIACRAWNASFLKQEETFLAQGKQPSFDETLAQLKASGISTHIPFGGDDRRAQIFSTWIEGVDLLKKKQWAAAEKVLAKAVAEAKVEMPGDADYARLLTVYAASLSPQGGQRSLRAASTALNEAENILRKSKSPDPEILDLVLGNLELVENALKEPTKANQAKERREQLKNITPE